MIMDKLLVIADNVDLPTDLTAAVTGYVDLTYGKVRKNAFGDTILGNWGGVAVNLMCGDDAWTSGGDTGTVTFQIITADDTALSTNATVLNTFITTAGKLYTQGEQIARMIIPDGPLMRRYIGVKSDVDTEALTAGDLYCYLGQLADGPASDKI